MRVKGFAQYRGDYAPSRRDSHADLRYQVGDCTITNVLIRKFDSELFFFKKNTLQKSSISDF